MMADIINIADRLIIHDNVTVDPHTVLKSMMDDKLTQVFIIARDENGEIVIAGSHGTPECLLLLGLAQHALIKAEA